MYYLCNENKDADQLRGYREADLRLCFAYAKCWFSHDAARIFWVSKNLETLLYLTVAEESTGVGGGKERTTGVTEHLHRTEG